MSAFPVPSLPSLMVGPLDLRAALLSLLMGAALLSLTVALLAPGDTRRPSRPTRFEVWIRQELARARLFDARLRDVAAASAVSGIFGWFVLMGLSGWPVYGVAGAAFGAAVPLIGISLRAQRLHADLQVALVDAIRQLRDALRSQASVRGGITLLATVGPPRLRGDFARVLDREHGLGGLDRALRELRGRLADGVGDQLVDALLVSLSTGGELLSQTLDDLASQAQGELDIRASIRAEQWKARMTAAALAVTPGLLLLFEHVVAPESVAPFDLPAGQVVLLSCAALCGGGYIAVLKVGAVPARPRLYGDGDAVTAMRDPDVEVTH